MDMAGRQNMYIVDGDSSYCKGPNYTFYVDGVGCSYIDHCIVSKTLLPSINECTVHIETIENMSDHLAISVNIHIADIPELTKVNSKSKIAWDKLSAEEVYEKYTLELQRTMNRDIQLKGQCKNAEDVEILLADIVNCMHTVSDKLKKSHYSKGLKPYWNDNLKVLQKEQKKLWREWSEAGRPRSGDLYTKYKEAKREFRNVLRHCRFNYEMHEMHTINRSHDMDQKYFWALVNRAKHKARTVNPLQINDKTLTDPNIIRETWKNYFKELYTPQESNQYDQEFKLHVEREIKDMAEASIDMESHLLDNPVNTQEVTECIKQLKNKKAPGWDQITAEHIKYGGQALVNMLTCLFNGMIQYEIIPQHLKLGVIIPIPKGDKDSTIMGNNRGITLLPVIGKLLEKVLLERHITWADVSDPLDSLQGAAQPHCSSVHTSLLLQETVAYNLERGSTVYVAMLDIQKAFDTVWTEGLLYKLFQGGMDPKLWRMLQKLYNKFECKVQINGELSEGFEAGRGVHQGAPWSMYLFEKYFNNLLSILKFSGVAAKTEHIKTGSPAFADDLAIICLHKPHIQRLLDKAFLYSQKWRFDFNPNKCAILVFGKDTSPSRVLTLGDARIPFKKAEVHMGILLTEDIESFLLFRTLEVGLYLYHCLFFLSCIGQTVCLDWHMA
jgi:hypothetical protein